MFKIHGLAIRRDGFKLVVAGVPERWHSKLKLLGWVRVILESILAVIGFVSVLLGISFSIPFITLLLSILIFIELGRPNIEYKYQTSYSTKKKTIGSGGSLSWDFDIPLTTLIHHYLDDDKNRIPNEDLGLYGSEHLELQIPPEYSKNLGESIESIDIALPFPARTLTIKEEPKEQFQKRTSSE